MPSLHPVTRYPATRYAETTRLSARVSDLLGVPLAFDLDPTPRVINGTPTAYQEFGGTTTANAHGQAVGLALDTKDTSLWGQLIPTAALNTAGGWAGAELPRWEFTANTATWTNNAVHSSINSNFNWYPSGYKIPIELSYTLSGFSGSGTGGVESYPLRLYPDSSTVIGTRIGAANATYKFRGYWREVVNPAYLYLYGAATNNFTLSGITAKRIDGNHAVQTVSAARPLLFSISGNRPGWAYKFDMIDDALIIYSVNQAGAGCTLYVVGLDTLTRTDNITISAQYTLSSYQYIRRALALTSTPTAMEDARIRDYFYKLYGIK